MENELAAAIRFQRTQGRVVEPAMLAMLGRDILRRTRLGGRKPFKFSTWRVHACVWRCECACARMNSCFDGFFDVCT